MGKYCTKCGRALADGEICNCWQQEEQEQQKQKVDQGQESQNSMDEGAIWRESFDAQAVRQVYTKVVSQQTKGIWKELAEEIINAVLHPVTAGKENVRENHYKKGIILIVVQGIFSAIYGMVACSRTFSKFSSLLGSLLGEVTSGWSDLLSFGSGYNINPSYGKIFFGTLVFSVVLSFALALLLFLGNHVLKNPVTYQQMLTAVGFRSCVVIIADILGIVLFFINAFVGILMFAAGSVWGLLILYAEISSDSENVRNKTPLMLFLVYLVFLLLTFLAFRMGYTLYLPSGLLG